MIDPIVSLAFGIYSNPGAYALLLGSGTSRAAQIPTGWEVVLDLISKYAVLIGESAETDPAAWYRNKFGKDADYSTLIEDLAKSPIKRNRLLRSYFEPTPEEINQGVKSPTRAHKAIANLVSNGFVKVVVTTNFDRLIEKALHEVGVTPIVISTSDAAQGVPPLAQANCTLIKVNGDYLDTRIKNTPSELASFDSVINQLLDRVFDEYGLIICGWSAEWDMALRDAISRCKNLRFTTYWASRTAPNDLAKDLISLRRAEIITIENADSFFQQLWEKVQGLRELSSRRHPISPRLAEEAVKKYVSRPESRIPLHDLVIDETEILYKELTPQKFPAGNVGFSDSEFMTRVHKYEALTEILRAILVVGCYWAESREASLWCKCIERIANSQGERSSHPYWLNLRLYPALLLLYSGGIAAVGADKLETLSALFSIPKIEKGSRAKPALGVLHVWSVMEEGVAHHLPGKEKHFTPLSDYLFEILREEFRNLIPDDNDYDTAFDRFEYLLGVAFVSLKVEGHSSDWGPVGRFAWKNRFLHEYRLLPMKASDVEAKAAGKAWPFVTNGLFNNSLDRFFEIKASYDKFALEVLSSWH